jgi:hypothetical protein
MTAKKTWALSSESGDVEEVKRWMDAIGAVIQK